MKLHAIDILDTALLAAKCGSPAEKTILHAMQHLLTPPGARWVSDDAGCLRMWKHSTLAALKRNQRKAARDQRSLSPEVPA